MTSPPPQLFHPSFLELDRAFLGLPSGLATRLHLEGCLRCREHFHFLGEEQAAAAPGAALASRTSRQARSGSARLGWRGMCSAGALAAAMLLVLARPHPDAASRAGDTGLKGTPAARVVAERERRVRALNDGDVVQAGDRLRLMVNGGGFTSLTVFTPRTDRGYLRLYAAPLTTAETPVLLPVAWRVDGLGEAETLLVVFARAELTEADVPGLLAVPRSTGHWLTILRLPKRTRESARP